MSGKIKAFLWAAAAAFAGVVGFVYSPAFQEFICHSSPVVWVEDTATTPVRGICFRPTSWTPTPADITDAVDKYLARASTDPGAAKSDYFTASARQTNQKGLAPATVNRPPVIWAERVGAITDRRMGNATITYEWWEAAGAEPRTGEHNVRTVRVGLAFEVEQDPHARFAAWGRENRIEDPTTHRRIGDEPVSFPRGSVPSPATFKQLPDQDALPKSDAKAGDTVRVICRVNTLGYDWLRTTDGFLPTSDVHLPNMSASDIPACQPQQATRASALYGGPP